MNKTELLDTLTAIIEALQTTEADVSADSIISAIANSHLTEEELKRVIGQLENQYSYFMFGYVSAKVSDMALDTVKRDIESQELTEDEALELLDVLVDDYTDDFRKVAEEKGIKTPCSALNSIEEEALTDCEVCDILTAISEHYNDTFGEYVEECNYIDRDDITSDWVQEHLCMSDLRDICIGFIEDFT